MLNLEDNQDNTKKVYLGNKFDEFYIAFFYGAILPLLPIILSIIFRKHLGNNLLWVLCAYVILYVFLSRLNLKILLRYANKSSYPLLAKRLVEVYAVVLVPIVTLGLLLLVSCLGWIQLKIIGLENIVSPISPYDHPVIWILICLFFSAYFINKSISRKN